MLDQKHDFEKNNEQKLADMVSDSRKSYGNQMDDLKKENARLKDEIKKLTDEKAENEKDA